MKGQLTVEFLSITVLLLLYLTTVIGVYSQTKGNLEKAADRKLTESVEKWIYFINQRPEGTEIKIKVEPYPGRSLQIDCGRTTMLRTQTGEKKLSVPSSCKEILIEKETRLRISRDKEGVVIEIS